MVGFHVQVGVSANVERVHVQVLHGLVEFACDVKKVGLNGRGGWWG